MNSIRYSIMSTCLLAMTSSVLCSCQKPGGVGHLVADNNEIPAEGYTGTHLVYRDGVIIRKIEYVAGKKNGEETLYYRGTGKIMSINHYVSDLREGSSERFEDYTSYLISSCKYKNGIIFSGAALLSNGSIEINPDQIMSQDLAYRVALFEDGVQVGTQNSETLFGHLWRK